VVAQSVVILRQSAFRDTTLTADFVQRLPDRAVGMRGKDTRGTQGGMKKNASKVVGANRTGKGAARNGDLFHSYLSRSS
jgi:hypothetical protein